MGKIAFTTDKEKVNVGEYFTVPWECRNPDMVTLSVQDGGKTGLYVDGQKIEGNLVPTVAGKTEYNVECYI